MKIYWIFKMMKCWKNSQEDFRCWVPPVNDIACDPPPLTQLTPTPGTLLLSTFTPYVNHQRQPAHQSCQVTPVQKEAAVSSSPPACPPPPPLTSTHPPPLLPSLPGVPDNSSDLVHSRLWQLSRMPRWWWSGCTFVKYTRLKAESRLETLGFFPVY